MGDGWKERSIARLNLRIADQDPGGLLIGVDTSWGSAELTVRLIGEFNVDNVLTVLAVLLAGAIY